MSDERLDRALALTAAAVELASPSTRAGKTAREALPSVTGLSPEGVDFALRHCLEYKVARGMLASLVRRTPRVRGAHVLLSSNVFVASYRAILLGLVQSPQVCVRASRREPVMTQLLHEASGGVFELCAELTPQAGDHFWAYGADETLSEVRRALPPGVHFHAHGAGLGVAVFREQSHDRSLLAGAVDGLARDTLAFDQRGCLSPRVVLVEGSRAFGELVADLLVAALDRWEAVVPRGVLSTQERADALRHEATMTYLGSSVRAGSGMVFLDPERGRILLPPTGRYLHITCVDDALSALVPLSKALTTVGIFNPGNLPGQLLAEIGERRIVDLGQMQRPILDGPVDLRSGWDSILT